MSQIYLDAQTRSTLAKALRRSLADHGLDIKHTLAVKVLAAMFGYNEHSLAAAIKAGTPITIGAKNKCSVPGCDIDAYVEVHQYATIVGPNPRVLDEVDETCPYLCHGHYDNNELSAHGSRALGQTVHYPYTNKNKLPGFSVYRNLVGSGEWSSVRPEDDPDAEEARILSVLESEPVHLLGREGADFTLQIGSLATPVQLVVRRQGDKVVARTSHAIHTPLQAGPYRDAGHAESSPAYAVGKAVRALTNYYQSAVAAGHVPSESWLVTRL